MIDWVARARTELASAHPERTDETDRTPVSSVSSVGSLSNPPEIVERPGRTCVQCAHQLKPGTCAQPLAAGLLQEAAGFGIVWPPEGHGAGCPAYAAAATTKHRPFRLPRNLADAAHRVSWNDEQIPRFLGRFDRLVDLGASTDDAEDLAEALHLRDVSGDDRVLCAECPHLSGRRCTRNAAAGLPGPELAEGWIFTLQRCPARPRRVLK